MRRYLTARWLALHALVGVLVVAFLALGWWQWRRGEAGNGRSFAYAVEWPLFAAFTVFMWVRLMRDDARTRAAAGGSPGESDPPDGPGAAGGDTAAGDEGRLPAGLPRVAARRAGRQAGQQADGDEEDAADEELAAYNRYLARLNAESERRR